MNNNPEYLANLAKIDAKLSHLKYVYLYYYSML